jgi:ribose transport system ATP-binding protein
VMKRPIAELAISDMTSAMLGRPLSDLFPPPAEPVTQSAPILEVRNLSQPGIIADVNLAVMPGEVVGIAGLMGSGRSETARVIFGLDPAVTGEVSVAGQRIEPRTPRNCLAAGVAFLTEDRRGDGLMMAEGILTNLQLARLADENKSAFTALPERALDSDSVAMAETVRIKAHDLRKQPTRSLSGGNQQKVVLGKWLLRDPKVFILDEPTRGIDVGAKAEIYGLIRGLAQRGAGVLIISSELEELFGTCHRILVMAHGEIVSEVHGPSFDRAAILEAAMQPQSGSA